VTWPRRLLLALVAATAALLLTAGGASAAGPCDDPSLPYDAQLAAGCIDPPTGLDLYLPSERWAGEATTVHSRKVGGFSGILPDLSTTMQRDMTFPVFMSVGNSLWSWTTSMLSGAMRMDFLDSMGAAIDGLVAAFGNAVFGSPLIAAIVTLGVIVVLWRGFRGRGNPTGYLVKAGGTVVLLAAMVIGAGNSTTTGGTYVAGTMSPGWLAQTTNGVISSLVSAPAAALSASTSSVPSAADSTVTGPLSCQEYVAELNRKYIASAGGTSGLAANMQSSTPMLLSRMWEQTGLQAWKVGQFGAENDYGEFMYCRLLDQRAGISASQQWRITKASGTSIPDANLNAAPWGTTDNDHEDRNLIAWAACRVDSSGSWYVEEEWASVSKKVINADDCSKWWGEDYFVADSDKPEGIISEGGTNFDWGGKASDTTNKTNGQPNVREFLLTLHGSGASVGGNLALVVTYLLSSLVIFIVFGAVSLGVLFAKLTMMALTLAIVFALLRDLLPTSASSAAGKTAKAYVGSAFVVFGIGLVIALLTTFTSAIITFAQTTFGAGSIATMMWSSAAPLISLLVLHWIFTKVLKVPSPLSVSGATAWGKAAAGGAVGGALGAGTAEMLQRRGSSAARVGARAAGAGARRAGGALATRFGGTRTASTGAGRTPRAGRGIANEFAAAGAGAGAGAAAVAAGGRANSRRGVSPATATPATSLPSDRSTMLERSTQRADRQVARREAREARQVEREETGVSYLDQQIDRAKAWKAEREVRAAAHRQQVGDERVARRGFDGGLLGDAREALSERMTQVRREYAQRPVRKTLGTAAKVAGVGAATVLTAGAALPVALAYSGVKQARAAGHDRRAAAVAHTTRLARQARERQELDTLEARRKQQQERAQREPVAGHPALERIKPEHLEPATVPSVPHASRPATRRVRMSATRKPVRVAGPRATTAAPARSALPGGPSAGTSMKW